MRLMRLLAVMTLKWQINLATDSTGMEGGRRRGSFLQDNGSQKLEPHMLPKSEAMAEELNLSKREGFGRETCLTWRKEIGES